MYRKTNSLLQLCFVSGVMFIVVLALLALTRPSQAAQVTAYPVNSSDDVDDGNCDWVHCSLREAINRANVNMNTDRIVFEIPGVGPHTIQPLSALPNITEPVIIDGYTQPGASPNTNPLELGTNAVLMIELDGTNAGSAAGLTLTSADNVVRGLVINRFDRHGISIFGSSATGNVVEGNFVGTNVDGTAAAGNGGSGVWIVGSASSNMIGGNTPDARNVISGNQGPGLLMTNDAVTNVVQGNFIGTGADGISSLGNLGDNVFITFGASDNTIGGTGVGAGNVIAYAGQNGIVVVTDDATNNAILSNSIFSNGLIAIDLGNDGVTANDPGDGDSGSNNLQNFPLISSATTNLDGTDIQGTLNSIALVTYTLDFFSSANCDPSGHGEGASPLGQATTTTDNGGNASFQATVPIPSPAGQFVTATATDPDGNTSEFSQCVPVVIAPISGLTAINDSPTVIGTPTTLTATIAAGGYVIFDWAFGDGNSGSGAVVTHTYPVIGVYTATVTATNPVNSVSATTGISVVIDIPISGLTAVNDSPTFSGARTTLTATVSAGSNVSYTWAFGDGGIGSGAIVRHTYPAIGSYTAIVTATNSVSAVTAATAISVVANIPIEGLMAVNSGPAIIGRPTTLTATITAGSNVSYTWDYGDGVNGNGAVVTHTYPAIGSYTATITATNPVSSASASTVVSIVRATDVSLTSLGALISTVNSAPWVVALAATALLLLLAMSIGRRLKKPGSRR